jgi:hypothetical protein
MFVLEDLTPAPRNEPSPFGAVNVEFDGTQGTATSPGIPDGADFTQFLRDAGYSAEEYEVVGSPRTSRWQRYDGIWLTSYRFNFRLKTNIELDLPTLFAEAKKTKKPVVKPVTNGKAFVILTADFQVGKVASRGGVKEMTERILEAYARIESHLKRNKYERIVILDAGDIVEGFENAANLAQLQSNGLSLPQQVDHAAALMWSLLKTATKYAPVTYASVGSNHCQWRVSKQTVGKPGLDDWGIVILQQVRRLAVEVGLDATFLIPEPYDESLTLDPFGDGFHIVGLAHGHQVNRPDSMVGWLAKQSFGHQPLAGFSIFCSGHFHHLRVEEIGQAHNGGSRYWVQGSTMDNGSDWYRLSSSFGGDSQTGIVAFELERAKHFQGTVLKF